MNDVLNKFVVLGDRLLVKPKSDDQKTDSGLYLPPGVKEKEKIQSAYVLKIGPGYAVAPKDSENPWEGQKKEVQYIPLEAHPGDLAIYLQHQSYEIEYEKEKYVIIPQSAVLLIIREH
jgi:chaperonin GroES